MDRFISISVFVAAIEEGSLAGAGRRFGLSPSMAGKYLSALEAELNVRLLQRSTRSLNPTDAGRRYYQRCKGIIEAFEDANREASDASQLIRGTLRISAPVTFASLHMGDVVARFLEAHPHINAEVLLDDRYVDLHTGGIDVAIRIGRLADSDLIARPLAPCRMVLCAAPDYLRREGMPGVAEDLRHAPRLGFSEAVSAQAWTLIDRQGQAHVIEGPLRMHANNMHMLLSAALAGVGIAYGPTFVFGQAIAAGQLIHLLPDCQTTELTVHAVYPTARHVPSRVRAFIDFVAAEFAGELPWDRLQPA